MARRHLRGGRERGDAARLAPRTKGPPVRGIAALCVVRERLASIPGGPRHGLADRAGEHGWWKRLPASPIGRQHRPALTQGWSEPPAFAGPRGSDARHTPEPPAPPVRKSGHAFAPLSPAGLCVRRGTLMAISRLSRQGHDNRKAEAFCQASRTVSHGFNWLFSSSSGVDDPEAMPLLPFRPLIPPPRRFSGANGPMWRCWLRPSSLCCTAFRFFRVLKRPFRHNLPAAKNAPGSPPKARSRCP